MDPRDTRSSFIPKQILTTDTHRERPTIGLFSLIALFVFILSLLFLGGSYAYAFYLRGVIERPCRETSFTATLDCGLEAKLKRIRENLQQNVIDDLRHKDAKIRAAESLLGRHNTVVPIFALLEDYTLKTISYSSLDYTGDQLTLSGEARSYESIALQSDIFFDEVREIDSFLFSDLSPDASGRVRFKLLIKLKPGLDSYQNYLGL